ncbi:YigZ family protein [Natranaerobius trueperi]|uniref:YigZ family protein n=1 Tax=Natranaerobius trueperi TaxID=759412 RepID=A0A226BZR0_9FIRM|nr:YigZ family protein [Natranaerobius trueperi]OWZ84538.1 YigZ family protein [Natranaerobius trueperi]
MVKEYVTVQKQTDKEIFIKKSRFISYVAPVSTETEAFDFINQIKERHSDATHNVFAFRVGLKSDFKRQSDDGEPSGTAGKPVLDVIENQGIRNVAVVVTRYFGGIKLGAGGLVRAYSHSAKEGIEKAKIVKRTLYQEYEIEIEYPQLGKLQNEIDERDDWFLRDIEYKENVRLVIAVPEGQDYLINYVENLTSGSGRYLLKGLIYL